MIVGRAWRRWITIGIRREEKSGWESRAPLAPSQVASLKQDFGVKFVVQPSNTRVFANQEYQSVGAEIGEDLEECDVIIGVKEIPESSIIPKKTYMCFSHTHKGQPYNMPMLKRFLDSSCTLLDYECLTDEKGARLVAFGKFAGYAGMINCLHGMGLQFLARGYRTPLLNVPLSHTYTSLDAAKRNLREVGQMIQKKGLQQDIQPILIIFTGNGNGAQEIAKELPIVWVKPEQISDLKPANHIYGCVVEAADYCVHNDGNPFTVEEYSSHPERFTSNFYEKLAPFATAIVNGIYWEARFPRLLTKKQTQDLLDNPSCRLLSIADISCDIEGSIEVTHKASNIEEPFFNFGAGSRKLQIMSIDNLPAQLPCDATEFFGARLTPIIIGLIQKGVEDPVISRAVIALDGQLKDRHKWLQSNLTSLTSAKKKKVVILGSGFVAGPVVKYLGARSDVELVIGTNIKSEGDKLSRLAQHGAKVEQIDINDVASLKAIINGSNVAISLVPATMHVPIAQACLEAGSHLVTASYISPQMADLQQAALDRRLLFLNEIGLDPGLDHLSAKKIIDKAHAQGKKVLSFTSWCGGLPAPECADNPLGYKFSWSPRGVLLAALNDARYRMNEQEVNVPGSQLLASVKQHPFHSPLNLEGIPNRDSLKYEDLYGLQGVQTMLRGTLRYNGFCELMRAFRAIGLIDLDPLPAQFTNHSTWSQVTLQLLPTNSSLVDRLGDQRVSVERVKQALEWLGMFSSEPFIPRASMLDSFCELLQRKLCYGVSERDMVVMQHEFFIGGVDQKEEHISSSLIEYGEVGGFSAMARTVGYPVAVAAEMILDEQTKQFGVQAPLTPDLYNPMLAKLEAIAGIRFKEQVRPA